LVIRGLLAGNRELLFDGDNAMRNFFLAKQISLIFILGCFYGPFLISDTNGLSNNNHISTETPKNRSEKDLLRSIDPSPHLPIQVESGVYVKSLGDFDYRADTFFIGFYIWWLTENANYAPEKRIEITNAVTYKRLFSERDKIGHKTRVLARYSGTINTNWNLKFFPFDRQELRISFEDGTIDIDGVRFSPMPDGHKMSPTLVPRLKEWEIINFEYVHEPHRYESNLGDVSKPFSVYSRMSIIFELKRNGWKIFFVYFVGYIISAILCLLTYFVPKGNFDTGSTICLGAIFAAVINKNQIDQSLSGITWTSFIGTFTLCIFFIILITIINVLVTHILFIKKWKKSSYISNYVTLFVLMSSFIAIMTNAIQLAIAS